MTRMENGRVLLVNPPQELHKVMGHTGKLVARWEPLGLLYLAAVLLEDGFDVQVLDAEADPHTVDEIMAVAEAYDPAVVGITCLTPTAALAVELGLRLRQTRPQHTVVMGNVHAHIFSEALLRLGACDFIVHGEGEFVFRELLHCLETNGDPAKVAGLSFVRDGDYFAIPPSPLITDLDLIPPPARHLVKHITYDTGRLNNLTFIRPDGTVGRHTLSSRGCVFECSFCVVHQERRFRVHSPERVVDEVVDLQENYNCGFITFIDSIFVADKKRVHGICKELQRRGVKIPWACVGGHVRMADRELLETMKAAGCVSMAYGIESGSQRMLNKVEKGTRLEHVHKAVQVTREVGLPMVGLFILGLPGETREEMEQTVELALSLPLDLAQFSMFVPYPGSKDFARLSEAGEIDTGVRPDGSVDLNVWRRYSSYVGYGDQGDSIYLPPGMTFEELFRLQRRAMRRFYLRPAHIWRNLKRIRPGNVADAVRAAGALFFKTPARKKRVEARGDAGATQMPVAAEPRTA